MRPVEIILFLLVIAAALAWIAGKLKIPYPILLVIGGLELGFVPHLPEVRLDPEIFFLFFLPPLLFHAGLMTSWRDFKNNLRPISLLAVGLVLFTTCAVAVLAHATMDFSWPSAFALGAIVSPPDAIAATAITRRLRIPHRVVTILEGESLVNDAAALVLYRAAVGATVTGTFVMQETLWQFVLAAVGRLAIGL